MYAIRSYYALFSPRGFSAPPGTPVITSYSIHYTKLYERKKGGKFPRMPARGKAAGFRDLRRGEGEKGRREVQREGRLRMTREGRSIVITDSPGEPAIRIPRTALSGALPKDRVLVRLEKRRGGATPYGRIIRIVERGMREFVGRYTTAGKRPHVITSYSIHYTKLYEGPDGSNTNTKVGYIAVGPLPPAPVAGFSATPTTGKAPLTVAFSDQSTGVISTWSWDFGDA